MIRTIAVLLFFILGCNNRTAFKHSARPVEISRHYNTEAELYADSSFISRIANVNGTDADTLMAHLRQQLSTGEFISVAPSISVDLLPIGWVSDYEGIFTHQQINELTSFIAGHEEKTTNQIAIVTLDSSWMQQIQFDSLIFKIGNSWGVGQKDKNNGIVIGICTGLKKIRICTGDGISMKPGNATTREIIDSLMIPAFKKGMYYEGTKEGLLAIIKELE